MTRFTSEAQKALLSDYGWSGEGFSGERDLWFRDLGSASRYGVVFDEDVEEDEGASGVIFLMSDGSIHFYVMNALDESVIRMERPAFATDGKDASDDVFIAEGDELTSVLDWFARLA